ncbi:MAG: hypothetical protein Q4E65_10045, partial [Clostridia bacterium]|nr:hypothetical protein [Clostridia bacterium]
PVPWPYYSMAAKGAQRGNTIRSIVFSSPGWRRFYHKHLSFTIPVAAQIPTGRRSRIPTPCISLQHVDIQPAYSLLQ